MALEKLKQTLSPAGISHSWQVARNYMRILHADQTEPDQIPKRQLRAYLPQNPVIVEAGAYKGYDTMQFSRIWPQARIHAFEPVPALFARLRMRMFFFRNVRCHPYALSAQSGQMPLYVSGGTSTASSSLLPPKEHLQDFPTVTFDQQVQVPCITLDDWATQQGLDYVDLLWLDLQGYELQALQAAPRILPTVRALVTEINYNEAYAGAATYPVLRNWLIGQGFVERIVQADGESTYGNALYINSARTG
jgi:2-O-methyltransferase